MGRSTTAALAPAGDRDIDGVVPGGVSRAVPGPAWSIDTGGSDMDEVPANGIRRWSATDPIEAQAAR